MLLFIIVFAILFFVIVLCVGFGMAFLETMQRKQLRQMLQTAEPLGTAPRGVLVRNRQDDSGIEQKLATLPILSGLRTLLDQSRIEWSAGKFLVLSVGPAIVAGFIGYRLSLFSSPLVCALGFAAVASFVPFLIVARKRSKTMAAFEKQFPEALDFISRSMRAGHGFNVSLDLVAADAAEPLASGFRRVSHEVQLGSPLNVALEKLIAIVPLIDVRFFVSAILLQQETGGNLSEILGKLAYVIRERFRLRGQVRAVSAHGRITGMVLLLMPVAVVLILLAMSPGYLKGMTDDPTGRLMLWGAVAGQFIAYFFIKKIVNIRV